MPLKTVRFPVAMLVLVVVFYGTLSIAGLFGAVAMVRPPSGWSHYDAPVAALLCLVCLAVSAASVLACWVSFKARTEFYPDRILSFSSFGMREIRRADVQGYRRLGDQEQHVLLDIRDGKPLKLSSSVLNDPALETWFAGIPDLDAQDSEAAERALEADPAWGSDVESRRARLARLRLVARIATGAAWAIGAWLWLWPKPYEWAVAAGCALLPAALAIQLVSGRRFSLAVDAIKTDVRPSLGTPILFAGIALAVRTIQDFSFLDWKTLLAASLAGGFGLTIASMVLDDKLVDNKWGVLVSVFLACTAYGYGAFAQGDVLLDTASPQKFLTAVRWKHVSGGKSTRYELHVAPWGPIEDENEIDVTRERYDATPVGQAICIYLKPGRFDVPWYAVSDC